MNKWNADTLVHLERESDRRRCADKSEIISLPAPDGGQECPRSIYKIFLSTYLAQLNNPNAELKPIELTVGIADNLSRIPRTIVPDMPDRIIAATALHLNLPLITKDHKIQALQNIKTIW